MPADTFLLSLAVKMAVTAAFVVTAALIAERVGALVGAMVATLPIAAGPAYILLALDHDTQFIADSTVASLAAHAATGVYGTAYVFAAQRHPVFVAVPVALGVWFGCAFLIRSVEWSLPAAILVCAASYAVCIVLVRGFLHVAIPPFTSRWLDIPLRALLVASPDRRLPRSLPTPCGVSSDSPARSSRSTSPWCRWAHRSASRSHSRCLLARTS
jgi:hypothetical protein